MNQMRSSLSIADSTLEYRESPITIVSATFNHHHIKSRLRRNYMTFLAVSYFHTLMDLAGDDLVPWIPKVIAVSYKTGQAILDEMKNGNDITLTIKYCHECKPIESGFKSTE